MSKMFCYICPLAVKTFNKKNLLRSEKTVMSSLYFRGVFN